jgi:AraC family transcriptional regulator
VGNKVENLNNPQPNPARTNRPEATVHLPRQQSVVLHASSRHHHWTGTGPLSIKSFPHGHAAYIIEGGRFRVDEASYLLLNAGQEYTVSVDCAQPVESFCIFFADGLADQVYTSVTASLSALLDDPSHRPTTPLHFYDKSYPHDAFLSTLLTQLRLHHRLPTAEPGWMEEMFHLLMQRLLHIHLQVVQEVASVPAMRAATRDELYRRLHRLADYIAACYQQPLTLNEMAQIACLSPNHLLRVFKQHFRQSPHQYLRAKRIEQARKLLVHSNASVTEVCYAVGFESLGSFSWRFRREVGMSPQQYRAAIR